MATAADNLRSATTGTTTTTLPPLGNTQVQAPLAPPEGATTGTTIPGAGDPTGFLGIAAQHGVQVGAPISTDDNDLDVIISRGSSGYRVGGTYDPRVKRKQSEVMAQLNKLSGIELRNMQERLFKAGYYGALKRNQIKWGQQADIDTQDAYKKAVARAAETLAASQYDENGKPKPNDFNLGALTLDEAIDSGIRTEEEMTGDAEDPIVFKTSSSEELAKIIKSSAVQVLGRRVSQAQIDKLTAAYQALEVGKQAEGMAATTGSVIEETPAASVFAEEQIRAANPGEAQAKDYSNAYATFSQLLSASEQNTIQG